PMRDAAPRHEACEAALHLRLLVGAQRYAHCALEGGAKGEPLLVGGCDVRHVAAATRCVMRAATSSMSASMAWAARSFVTRGMPKPTQLASSCTTTAPPAASTSAAPSAPSRPMPVRMATVARGPYAARTDSNVTSTLGRTPCRGGSWFSRIR